MLGFSTGQLVVILGACSLMMKRSDMIKIARVAGRMTGRAVGRLMLFRRQIDEILEQTAAKQVLCNSPKPRITSCVVRQLQDLTLTPIFC